MENKAARRYLSRVKRALVCGGNDRRRLLDGCAGMISGFQQENPEAGYAGLTAAFGEPKAFAAQMLSDLDEASVAAARKRRLFLRLGALALIIAALVATSVFWYIKYRESKAIGTYYYVVAGPPEVITDEEFAEGMANSPKESQSHLREDER